MTTIAYRAGEMAGETRVVTGGTVLPERSRKVFKLRGGRLFGAAGNSTTSDLLRTAVEQGAKTPKLRGVDALLVEADGSLWFYEHPKWSRVLGEYAAIGSGANHALGAFYMNAGARDAVKAGCKFDAHSGGRIHVVRLRVARVQNPQ